MIGASALATAATSRPIRALVSTLENHKLTLPDPFSTQLSLLDANITSEFIMFSELFLEIVVLISCPFLRPLTFVFRNPFLSIFTYVLSDLLSM